MRAALLLVSALLASLFIAPSTAQQLSCQQMVALVDQYFGWDAWLMMCIAWIESNWEPGATNPSGATGLWQIMVPLLCGECDCSTLLTADGNAQCALTILQSTGLNAWTPDPTTCVNWYNGHDWPFPSCVEMELAAKNATLGPRFGKLFKA